MTLEEYLCSLWYLWPFGGGGFGDIAAFGVESVGVGGASGTNSGSRRQSPGQAGTGLQGRSYYTKETSIKWVDDEG